MENGISVKFIQIKLIAISYIKLWATEQWVLFAEYKTLSTPGRGQLRSTSMIYEADYSSR